MTFRYRVGEKYKVQALAVGKFTIPTKMEGSLQIAGDLSNIKNWKAKVILCNSGNTKRGEWEKVGYVGFEPKTGIIVPIARADEHHTGYDLLDYLIRKKLIPKGNYQTIWALTGPNYGNDKEHIQELIPIYKRWLELGGPNLRIATRCDRQSKYMSFQELIDGGAWKEHKTGTLTTFGNELVALLEKTAQLYKKAITSQKQRPPRKQLSNLLFDIAKFADSHRTNTSYYDLIEKIQEAASNILKGEDIDKNMQVVFGFDGVKNKIHNDLRESLKKGEEAWGFRDAKEFWGDPKFALEEFDRLSAI